MIVSLYTYITILAVLSIFRPVSVAKSAVTLIRHLSLHLTNALYILFQQAWVRYSYGQVCYDKEENESEDDDFPDR